MFELNQCVIHQKKLKSLQDKVSTAQKALDKINGEIEEQQKLAGDIEKKVLQKIADSRKNVAEFISNMAFTAPFYTESRNVVIEKAESSQDMPIKASREEIYISGERLAEDSLDHYSKWDDALMLIEEELASAGVDPKMRAGLAAFLFCAWKNNVWVLLAGPNAIDIVDAFSSAIMGKLADKIECEGTYMKVDIPTSLSGQIIAVKNVFQGNWIDHIADLADDSNYYFFINPFAEDLSIEPKGLYNYMIPVFTDLVVSDKSCHEFYGGIPSSEYVDFKPGSKADRYSKFLTKNGASKLCVSQIEQVLGDLSKIPGYRADWDYYYAILPYMLAAGHKNNLLEHVRQANSLSKECREAILNYLGVEE